VKGVARSTKLKLRLPAEARPALPFISVIMPVRNEERFVGRTLAQLLAQDYPPDRYEILVADGASTDRTAAVVRGLADRHPHLRLLNNPARLSSAGRNRAVRASRGDLVLLVDGHCEIDHRRYLRDLADAFAGSGADCVGRPQPLDVPGATALQRAIASARSSPLGHHPASYIYSSAERFVPPQSVAVAYRRAVFERLGLFDESFDACEDVEFNHRVARAGLRCWLSPRALVRYHPRTSLRGLFGQMARYGRGRVRLLRKHPETFSPAVFLPALFLLGVAVGWAPACLAPGLLWPYLGVLALYALAVLGVSVLVAARAKDARLLPWLPPVFATVHAGAAVGVLHELAAGFFRRPVANPSPLESNDREYLPPARAA
jgi:cellulose synthase/poly-beta-1,6-N-acetylglucosamine synthase-like glycosyltransferase